MTPAIQKLLIDTLCTLSDPRDKMAFIESVGAWLTHQHNLLQGRHSVPFVEVIHEEKHEVPDVSPGVTV